MTTGPKERPILFSGEMVLAILRGNKTQTRRVIKPQPWQPTLDDHLMPPIILANGEWGWSLDGEIAGPFIRCPYGHPRDRLWVRETFAFNRTFNSYPPSQVSHGNMVHYAATIGLGGLVRRPSVFMPRWASRITLEIIGVRVERMQDISEEDAKAEGFIVEPYQGVGDLPSDRFQRYWNHLNAKRGYGWKENPWVWVIEFKRIKP